MTNVPHFVSGGPDPADYPFDVRVVIVGPPDANAPSDPESVSGILRDEMPYAKAHACVVDLFSSHAEPTHAFLLKLDAPLLDDDAVRALAASVGLLTLGSGIDVPDYVVAVFGRVLHGAAEGEPC